MRLAFSNLSHYGRIMPPGAHRGACLFLLTIAALAAGVAQSVSPVLAQVPSAKDVVAPSAYVSLDPAGRGSAAQVAVVMKIRPGFHVNAREKSEEYLIATDLKSDLPAGFSAGEVAYPKGKLQKFTFSKTPLNVYEGTVTLRMPLNVLAAAPTGEQHIPLKLRYQACSTELCLPPVTLSIEAVVHVAESAAASKPAHPEIFTTKR